MSEEFNGGNAMNDQSSFDNSNMPVQGGESKGLAIASMICGIASIVLLCVQGYVALAAAIAAIVLAVVSNKKIGKNGMAIAGLVCGIVTIALFVIVLILAAIGVAALASLA